MENNLPVPRKRGRRKRFLWSFVVAEAALLFGATNPTTSKERVGGNRSCKHDGVLHGIVENWWELHVQRQLHYLPVLGEGLDYLCTVTEHEAPPLHRARGVGVVGRVARSSCGAELARRRNGVPLVDSHVGVKPVNVTEVKARLHAARPRGRRKLSSNVAAKGLHRRVRKATPRARAARHDRRVRPAEVPAVVHVCVGVVHAEPFVVLECKVEELDARCVHKAYPLGGVKRSRVPSFVLVPIPLEEGDVVLATEWP
mmetsp:Transcript_12851/g.38623  ORF Transcript_12851/g.38623 Transcript_12851/m.38623 type:complete len:256 (-) Transcript_12851:249-1016(-)